MEWCLSDGKEVYILKKKYVCIVTVSFCVFFTGECAVLDKKTYNLDFVKCYASSDCPPDAYLPSESFKCKLLCVVIS